DDTFTADKNANVVIENIRSRIRGGESFGRLARQFSHDRKSASNDGVIGWISFGEVDREIVGYVYNMKEQGKVSPVFKTNKGYHIIKYLGRRYLPYNEIRDRIFQMISQQSRMNQFQEWVKEQRKFSDIRVFIPGYEELRNSAHVEEQPSPIR
ncbi:MAG: peptidylprolyl isomerase, partial [Spirochaetota bacterium]